MLGGRSPIQGSLYNLSTPSCSLYSKELTRAALSPTHTPTPLHPTPPLVFHLPSSSRLPFAILFFLAIFLKGNVLLMHLCLPA